VLQGPHPPTHQPIRQERRLVDISGISLALLGPVGQDWIMGPYEDILLDIVERFGVLESVTIARTVLNQPEEYELGFRSGVLLVGVNQEDDTVRLSRGKSNLPERLDISAREPWNRVIGSSAIWAWELRNQQGYRDALQIEFSLKPGFVTIQLVCQASAIQTLKVEEVEVLTSPWTRD
jgi:hypothetical protein